VVVLKRTVGRDQGDAIKVFLNGRHDQLAVGMSSIAVRFGVRRLVAACLLNRFVFITLGEERSTKSHEARPNKTASTQMRSRIVLLQEPQSLKMEHQQELD